MDLSRYIEGQRARYEAFAQVVANIIRSALDSSTPPHRIQQIQTRAKAISSLTKKLEDRGLLDSDVIENEIKDLAGCRLIFYTNSDVDRLLQSGLIQDNFTIEWDATKVHYPTSSEPTTDELYIGIHYVVRLTRARAVLPEYAPYAEMRCEIQIQTILSHAWSETSHDITYKRPNITGFGRRQFDDIKKRLARIMKEHLLPAGYEFQKVQDDFERLIEGKELFDKGPLEALAQASDNNERYDLLKRIHDVIPYYDDLPSVYEQLRRALAQTIAAARQTAPRQIETPFGSYEGKSTDDVSDAAIEILENLRYVDVEGTFRTLCDIYMGVGTEAERERIIKATELLAKNDLRVWKQVGPAIQAVLVDLVSSFDETARAGLRPIAKTVCRAALEPEISGTSSSSQTITFSRTGIPASAEHAEIRTKAIELLLLLYEESTSVEEKRDVIADLWTATGLPADTSYGDRLCAEVQRDSQHIAEFFRDRASEPFELLEHLEHDFLFLYRRAREIGLREDLKEAAAEAQQLAKIILVFRDSINANVDFVRYKILVGFESVFPPEWEDDDDAFLTSDAYRRARLPEFVAAVTDETAADWWRFIELCAATKSQDMATFPLFGDFLVQLATAKPDIVIKYLERPDPNVMNFLPAFLAGLSASEEAEQALALMLRWVSEGRSLAAIARHLRFARDVPVLLMKALLDKAVEVADVASARELVYIVVQREGCPNGPLVVQIFEPALKFLTSKRDSSWVDICWYLREGKTFFEALEDGPTSELLSNLVFRREIDVHAEHILTQIARKRPETIWSFFGRRIAQGREREADERYRAVRYQLHELATPLAAHPALAVSTVWTWYDPNDPYFKYEGGRLLARIFPDFPQAVMDELRPLLREHGDRAVNFVIEILSSYEGEPFLLPIAREIVGVLQENDERLDGLRAVLMLTGTVAGQFGLVEAYQQKRKDIEPWLQDADAKIRAFAKRYAHQLEQAAAAEQRRAEQYWELRKRRYESRDEDPNEA